MFLCKEIVFNDKLCIFFFEIIGIFFEFVYNLNIIIKEDSFIIC